MCSPDAANDLSRSISWVESRLPSCLHGAWLTGVPAIVPKTATAEAAALLWACTLSNAPSLACHNMLARERSRPTAKRHV